MAVSDIPSHRDFLDVGLDHLQLAWDQVANLMTTISDGYNEYDKETEDEYWSASRRILLTAATIMQQGVELSLKGYIAEVTPYLLIQDTTAKFSGISAEGNILFSDFKSVDAQDLIRMISTFTNKELSDTFRSKFEEIRKMRNKITHSTAQDVSIGPSQLVELILEMHSELFPQNHWPTDRSEFLDRMPVAHLGAYEFTRNTVCWEMEAAINLLKPAKVKKYFHIDKKQRRYSCPQCLSIANRDAGFETRLAVLKPKSPTSTNLYCFICDKSFAVKRVKCDTPDCKGNVLYEDDVCLTCAY